MGDFPHIQAAIAEAAGYVRDVWQQVVMGTARVPGARPLKVNFGLRDIYAKSIILDPMIAGQGLVTRRVVATKQIARDLEDGKGPWDMKPMLLNGPKSRIGKKGNRYNIIPFRHDTSDNFSPNSNFRPMPQDIYQQARKLKASVRQGKGMKWGERLPATGTPGQNPTTGYQHKADVYEGMARIAKSYEKAAQSKHLTFRVVSANSDPQSWWHPGYEAHHIAQGVAEFCRPAVSEMVREGAIDDLLNVASLSVGMNVTRG
jgi:hypothetical protein